MTRGGRHWKSAVAASAIGKALPSWLTYPERPLATQLSCVLRHRIIVNPDIRSWPWVSMAFKQMCTGRTVPGISNAVVSSTFMKAVYLDTKPRLIAFQNRHGFSRKHQRPDPDQGRQKAENIRAFFDNLIAARPKTSFGHERRPCSYHFTLRQMLTNFTQNGKGFAHPVFAERFHGFANHRPHIA